MKKPLLKCTIKSISSHPYNIASVTPLLFSVFVCLFFVFFAYFFHLIFSLSLTLVIDNFCCFNYTCLLYHSITTHLVSHLSFSPIIFIVSTLIISNFYGLNYTLLLSLLLHIIVTHFAHTFYYNYVISIYLRELL